MIKIEKSLKENLWNKIKKRLEINFLDKKNIYIFVFILGFLFVTFLPSFYDWKIDSYRMLGITTIISFIFGIIFFGFLYKKPGFRTFLFFWLVFSIFMFAFDMLRYDIDGLVLYFGSMKSIKNIIIIIQPIFMLSFVATNAVIFILLIIIIIVGFIEARITISFLKRGFTRFLGSIFFEVLIFSFLFSIIEGIRGLLGSFGTLSSNQELIHDFKIDDLYRQTSLITQNIIQSISGMLFLMWIPIFMKINKYAKGRIFPNYSREITFSFLIIFLVKLSEIQSVLLFEPVFLTILIIISVLGFFGHIYYINKTFYKNWKIRKEQVYIPFTSSYNNMKNPFVKGLILIKKGDSIKAKINLILEQFV